jgi:hypothetical protein
LRQFARAESCFMSGGVKRFALIMTTPDLETQRFYHRSLSGELEYLPLDIVPSDSSPTNWVESKPEHPTKHGQKVR